jgi:hypothetical protein
MTLFKSVAALAAVFAAPFCAPAHAMDYEIGKSLVCDTQVQVERFVAHFSGDATAAVKVVNAEEHNPSACAIVNVAYVRGASTGMARHGDSAYQIVRILVVGVEAGGDIHAVNPGVYFSVFSVREYAI